MAERKRFPNFTTEEKFKLLSCVRKNEVLLSSKTDKFTNKSKLDAWTDITNSFNAIGVIKRNTPSLKKMWDKLKSDAKTYKAKQRIEITATGGGSNPVKDNKLLDEMLCILGRGGVGISHVNDSDADLIQEEHNMEFEFVGEDEYAVPSLSVTYLADLDATPSNIATPVNSELNYTSGTLPLLEETTNIPPTPPARVLPSRRRPLHKKNDRDKLVVAKLECEEKKKALIEEEHKHAIEMNKLKKRKLLQEIEINDLIIEKLKDNNVNPQVMATALFKNLTSNDHIK